MDNVRPNWTKIDSDRPNWIKIEQELNGLRLWITSLSLGRFLISKRFEVYLVTNDIALNAGDHASTQKYNQTKNGTAIAAAATVSADLRHDPEKSASMKKTFVKSNKILTVRKRKLNKRSSVRRSVYTKILGLSVKRLKVSSAFYTHNEAGFRLFLAKRKPVEKRCLPVINAVLLTLVSRVSKSKCSEYICTPLATTGELVATVEN